MVELPAHDGLVVSSILTGAIVLLLALPAYADVDEEEPTILLQPHPVIPNMILWRRGKPRRAIKRGVISSIVIDIAVNVVYLCVHKRGG